MKIRSRSIALAFNVFLAAASSAGAQDHIYNLNGTLADANGGPSLASLGGTLGATGVLVWCRSGTHAQRRVGIDVHHCRPLSF